MSSAPVCQSSDAELLAGLGALETQSHSTSVQILAVVAEIDSRAIVPGLGYGSTVELVRAIARIPRSDARARVNAAADVAVIRSILARIPPHLGRRILAYLDPKPCSGSDRFGEVAQTADLGGRWFRRDVHRSP